MCTQVPYLGPISTNCEEEREKKKKKNLKSSFCFHTYLRLIQTAGEGRPKVENRCEVVRGVT